MSIENLNVLLEMLTREQNLITATLSSPRTSNDSQKITIRPLSIKGQLHYQVTDFQNGKALHRNITADAFLEFIRKRLLEFKQTFFYTADADYQILIGKKSPTILKKAPSKSPLSLVHNRKKNYILEEGIVVPFLSKLGVMSAEGKVYPKKSDKFKQINRFLELIQDVISNLDPKKTLQIIDFGCGKAYLTFALYHYLKIIKGYNLKIIGLDLKEDVIATCTALANELGYKELQFSLGDINTYQTDEDVDMVVSLHACDTATDAAIEKAVRWQAEVILAVPCCQHELYEQISNETLSPLLKHGILKERFAALATDAARAQLLDILGYQTQILEFIDLEHTPKNLLIRAIKRKTPINRKESLQAYFDFKKHLHADLSLERRFKQELENLAS